MSFLSFPIVPMSSDTVQVLAAPSKTFIMHDPLSGCWQAYVILFFLMVAHVKSAKVSQLKLQVFPHFLMQPEPISLTTRLTFILSIQSRAFKRV